MVSYSINYSTNANRIKSATKNNTYGDFISTKITEADAGDTITVAYNSDLGDYAIRMYNDTTGDSVEKTFITEFREYTVFAFTMPASSVTISVELM